MKKIVWLEKKTNSLSVGSHWALTLAVVSMFAILAAHAPATQAQNFSNWSAPINLGSTLNSTANDQQPALSPDGLSLYFASNRSGGLGGFDIYVSHRAGISDRWGAPVNLGVVLNTADDEGNAAFSRDGRLLFFQSKRAGGLGGVDIWLARRNDPQNDFDWQPAVNLGAAVNSTADDSGPGYFEDEARGTRQLYFGSMRSGGPGGADIYLSGHLPDDSFSTATLVTQLNSPLNENDVSIRRGGLEIIFQSNRTGSNNGSNDLWVATRASALATWSTPVNLPGPVNIASAEQNAYFSSDGTELFFSSDRSGGFGGPDLYFSTRAKRCSSGDLFGGSPNGPLTFINQTDGSAIALGTPVDGGMTGIAFDSQGRLFASTRDGNKLIQIDPESGKLISTIGQIKVGTVLIPIGDLAFQPGTDVLFGVRSNADGVQAGGELFKINVVTAAATYVGDTGAGASGGIAFTPNGTLYQAAHNSHFDFRSLNTIDPTDAHRIRTVPLTTNYYDGLGFRPSDGMLIGTIGGGDTIYTINPDTGVESLVGSTGSGVSDVDFRICGPNHIDDAQFFVRQHYADFLSRPPDAIGLDFWTVNITNCGVDAHCSEVKRIDTSAAFFLSIEFQQTGYLVYRIYKASYGNLAGTPVPVRISEFLPDTQQIGQGVVVNQTGWEQLLESNKQAFATEFVQRLRFTSAYPTSLTPAAFVDALFANAAVTPATADRAAAINEFGTATNTTDLPARARALRRVAENASLAQQEFNKAFVLMQYFGYLRRNPNDSPETGLNFDGYNFWLTKLNQFNGNYSAAEMVKAFITSGEYRQRFGP